MVQGQSTRLRLPTFIGRLHRLEFARLKHLLTGASGRVDRRSQTKLIKEDHFACTTKMSEFFMVHHNYCVSSACNEPGSRPDRSSTLDPLNTHPRGHSDYSLVKEQH